MLYVTIFGSLLYLNGQYVLYFLYSLKPLCLQACGDAQRAIGATNLCLVLPICFVLSWFMCAINITLCEKKIMAENRDIYSKLKKIFFPESCRPNVILGFGKH